MRTTRRIVLVLVAIVMATGLYYGFRSYDWKGVEAVQTPTGVKNEVATFSCAPLFGSNYAYGPAYTPAQPNGTPCGDRQSYQIMDGADLLGGGLLAGAMLVWPLRRRHPGAAVPTS